MTSTTKNNRNITNKNMCVTLISITKNLKTTFQNYFLTTKKKNISWENVNNQKYLLTLMMILLDS